MAEETTVHVRGESQRVILGDGGKLYHIRSFPKRFFRSRETAEQSSTPQQEDNSRD